LDDKDEQALRQALDHGNLLAAAPLATFPDSDDAELAVLQRGLPASTALFGLMRFYRRRETDKDLVYQYARDGILATPAQSIA
jgi:hypothetical protein